MENTDGEGNNDSKNLIFAMEYLRRGSTSYTPHFKIVIIKNIDQSVQFEIDKVSNWIFELIRDPENKQNTSRRIGLSDKNQNFPQKYIEFDFSGFFKVFIGSFEAIKCQLFNVTETQIDMYMIGRVHSVSPPLYTTPQENLSVSNMINESVQRISVSARENALILQKHRKSETGGIMEENGFGYNRNLQSISFPSSTSVSKRLLKLHFSKDVNVCLKKCGLFNGEECIKPCKHQDPASSITFNLAEFSNTNFPWLELISQNRRIKIDSIEPIQNLYPDLFIPENRGIEKHRKKKSVENLMPKGIGFPPRIVTGRSSARLFKDNKNGAKLSYPLTSKFQNNTIPI